MRRICLGILIMAVCGGAPVRAQDAALQQRLNELSGRMETLIEALEVQRKQISTVTRQVDQLREEVNKPQAEAASPEDVRRIADAVREVDRKRLDDYEKIRGELRKLADAVEAFVKHPPVARAAPAEKPKPQIPEKGYEYEVQPGDTLSVIIQAYREKNVRVTQDQIVKANPGLNPNLLRVGQKIFIPAP